jgi:hypothetical protein
MPVRIAGLRAEIWIQNLPNEQQELRSFDVDVRSLFNPRIIRITFTHTVGEAQKYLILITTQLKGKQELLRPKRNSVGTYII